MKPKLFDLMSEYTVLLMDQLLSDSVKARILTVGRRTLPEGLFRHINRLSGDPGLDAAVEQLDRDTLLPKALMRDRLLVSRGLKELVQRGVIGCFNVAQSLTVWDVFFTDAVTWSKNRQKAKFTQRKNMVVRALHDGD